MDKKNWIPVSERLPEEDGYYLVCAENGHILIAFFQRDKWINKGFYDIVSWQKLPEPYTGHIQMTAMEFVSKLMEICKIEGSCIECSMSWWCGKPYKADKPDEIVADVEKYFKINKTI